MVTSYTIALLGHIVGVLLFVSGIVLAGVPFEVARRRSDPAEISLILSLTRIGVLFVAAGTVMVLGFGLWLVHLGRFGYDAGWVQAALVLFVVALALAGSAGAARSRRASERRGSLLTMPRPMTNCVDCSTIPCRASSTTPRRSPCS